MTTVASGPALALLELTSIARGFVVADAMVKKAAVALVECGPTSPGKFVIVITGGVAEVDEAFRRGLEVAGDTLIDQMLLPHADDQLSPALRGEAVLAAAPAALGVIETMSVAATVRAADAAVKAAAVRLCAMRLARGIGGKAFFSIEGELADVEAAVLAALDVLAAERVVRSEIIARPHEDLRSRLREGQA